jgi:hypothetical protein
MTARDKLFPCKECRFVNLDRSVCYRNPPDNGRPACIHAYLKLGWGCFAGEPRVRRSCDNCRFERTTACHIYNELQYCLNDKSGWYCSDWEGVDK